MECLIKEAVSDRVYSDIENSLLKIVYLVR